MYPLALSTSLLLALLGLLGGVLTTIAGMGGGLFLVLSLSALHGPLAALAITSPALFLSNAHRAFLFRRVVEARVVGRFAVGAVPAALIGGLVATRLPLLAVKIAMLLLAALAVARSLRWVRFAPGSRVFIPMSAGVGVLAAAAGGAGFLVGPLLLATGLGGSAYVGTVALCAVALHGARIVGYRAGGLLTSQYLLASLLLFAGLFSGNLLGRRLRQSLTPRLEERIELVALLVCTALGLLGIGLR